MESILQQTYQEIEIILIDDGSTDNTFEIAQKYECKKITAVKQSNSGAAVARNTGLAHARGYYIQFMDIDDFISVDKIEKQVAALQHNPECVAVCNYISFLDGEDLQSLPPADQSAFIYSSDHPADFLLNLWGANGESNFIQTNSWLVPRTIIERSGVWRNYRCPDDDGEFFARVLLAAEGIIYTPGVYNYYRRTARENKLSRNSNKKYVQNTLLTIDLKYNYLKKMTGAERLNKAFAKQYLDFAVHNFPSQKILSAIAWRRYKVMGQKASVPLLGGKIIELVKTIFGWKAARLLKYYLG